ncbi:hypothetical protein ACHWQZ_G009049 [Mnemiopsis leidyi]
MYSSVYMTLTLVVSPRTPPAKKGRYNLTNLRELTPRLAAEQLSNSAAAHLLTKYKEVDGILRRREEEHITLVDQPSGQYLGFATPQSGSGAATQEAVLAHCPELEIDLSSLTSCECDGTQTQNGTPEWWFYWRDGTLPPEQASTKIRPMCHPAE